MHTIIPGELRGEINLDAVNEFGVDYAIERLLSREFRNLANQEYNRLLFIENAQRQDIEGLLERLETYRLELESSLIWH